MKKEMGKMLRDVVAKNRAKLHEVANMNTKRNEKGLTVIEKGDPWREDESSTDNQFKLSRSASKRALAYR